MKKSETQLERYKRLVAYIDEHFKEDINIQKVEEVCHYSYRNINRIFQALHQETIGKYIKRIRLEKAAQYLKYSDESVSDIAFEVGFEDIAAFSKAFKNKFKCSPTAFRNSSQSILELIRQSLEENNEGEREQISFEIEYLPDFEFLSIEYRGAFGDNTAIEKTWNQLIKYADKNKLLNEKTIYMSQIVDDNEISDSIHSRYNLTIIPDKPINFEPKGLFTIKKHQRHKYAKFIHRGSEKLLEETYNKIYAFWMVDVNLELADLPVLEFYINYEDNTPEEDLTLEIYIPVF